MFLMLIKGMIEGGESESSNINAGIMAILNLSIFLQEDFAHTKNTKSIRRVKIVKGPKTSNKRLSSS